ncbi:nucleotide exchange factor GrpE [Microbaculum marinisediminis]|uniref:Protein GrpE n=1 Tax=Microbaculum marinisediminis TaxID=2931392 RepID=A0AAW5R0X6_9HYPH|nr:nucleotide exchange factor GrpE [Microbaculum sp. A6E488]MCT8972170.1 nucleotide exchange factor GrpE [Microbaculum sp. A6E488]
MSDETRQTAAANEATEAENRATENRADGTPATEMPNAKMSDGGATAPEPDPIETLKTENADLRDRLLRTVAEMENLRKRAEREVREAGQYAISRFAHDLLGVGDNMRRALEAVGGEAREAADSVLIGLLDGVEMTERELLKTLEKHGVTRIAPQGERFDPNFHQAMFEVPDESVPSGTVVQVVQSGYKIGERCLRPAMVGVSKGGPKAAKPESAETAPDGPPQVDKTA